MLTMFRQEEFFMLTYLMLKEIAELNRSDRRKAIKKVKKLLPKLGKEYNDMEYALFLKDNIDYIVKYFVEKRVLNEKEGK